MLSLLNKVKGFLQNRGPAYHVAVFRRNSDPATDVPLQEVSGSGKLPVGIHLDGFSRMLEIELGGHWQKMRNERLSQFQFRAKTYETYVKFGEVIQESSEYQVVLRLS